MNAVRSRLARRSAHDHPYARDGRDRDIEDIDMKRLSDVQIAVHHPAQLRNDEDRP